MRFLRSFLKARFPIVGNLAKKLKLPIDVVVAQLQLMEVWEVTYDSTLPPFAVVIAAIH